MDARERIQQLMQERNWTIYRLAKEAGMSQTTVSNIFKRNNEPSIPTLRRLCAAFGITMAQFFTTAQDTEHTKEQQELIDNWERLSEEKRQLLSADGLGIDALREVRRHAPAGRQQSCCAGCKNRMRRLPKLSEPVRRGVVREKVR